MFNDESTQFNFNTVAVHSVKLALRGFDGFANGSAWMQNNLRKMFVRVESLPSDWWM